MAKSIHCYDCNKIKETPKCGYCRECQRKRNIAYRSNKDKVIRPRTGLCRCGGEIAPNSKYLCISCVKQYQINYRKNNPEIMSAIDKRVSERRQVDPIEKLKRRARRITRRAIDSGFLDKDVCERCGTDSNVKAHHEDYNKPLEIKWLCVTHHEERHTELIANNVDLNNIKETELKKASFELNLKSVRRTQQRAYIDDFMGCCMSCDICGELGGEEGVLPYDDNLPYVNADYDTYDAKSFGITWRCTTHKPKFAIDLEERLFNFKNIDKENK